MNELNRPDAFRLPKKRSAWAKALLSPMERRLPGDLTLILPGERRLTLRAERPGPPVTLEIRRTKALWRSIFGGELGLAESYMEADWDASDLVALMQMALKAKAKLEHVVRAYAHVDFLNRARSPRRPNTKAQAPENISYHYDLGNSFYEKWLDETMTYSSALFTRPELSLAEAQREKYRRIAASIDLQPNDRVLEIGCGWGGFLEYAAGDIGCRVTGITLSAEQARFAQARIERAGLSERAAIRLVDYRDVEGTYDKIVSIEMFEAVGEEYWPTFFDVVRNRLSPGGRAALQVITISERLFERYRRRIDFIQRYIFPGGVLPSPNALSAAIATAGLRLEDGFFFGESYAATLRLWDGAFRKAWSEIAREGFDERFFRMWTYYLAYCEAGFRMNLVDVGQFVIARD
ncbi:SAM-dependent methyltransferase [Methylocapsa palsarum]|uniref:Cyclopropane-fatty-acyl-phospholipid synthase n=1 Tax=Methylocapsa palsarum TaxID=1612308 RepID=A0A1I4BFD4_9HYPH|nr:cyclopropane-fatty-acyl-phospholipid synthase family protein [Methylocapsa palsarum]SFK66689.1 cyclopropane-fatty-acyl-phospholipid synthase [Methylocapsa palsarum]